jgi:hypothetical protein
MTLAQKAAQASQSRGHSGATGILHPRPNHSSITGARLLGDIGKYTIGMGYARPSEMLHNLRHPLRRPPAIEFNRALTTDEFLKYQRTGIPPLDAIKPQHGGDFGIVVPGRGLLKAASRVVRGGEAAKEVDPLVHAAAMHHNMTGEAVAETAKKFGVEEKALRKHLKGAGRGANPTNENLHPEIKSKQAARDVNQGVADTLGESGGHTWHRDLKTDKGADGYAVSIAGHERVIPASTFDQNDVVRFWKDKKPLLKKNKNLRVGAWRDGDDVYLDLTEIHPTRAQAMRAGVEHQQQAIYERSTGTVHNVEGQGPHEMPPEVQDAANKITAALGFGRAKALEEEQAAMRSTERGVRAGHAQAAMEEQHGVAGHMAAREQLRGELPQIDFPALKGKLDPQAVDDVLTYIETHPKLRTYERIRTQRAVLNILRGRLPTPSERALLYKSLGREWTKQAEESISGWTKMGHELLSIANIPRSLMASYDISAPFRQGLVAGARHPVMFAKNFRPMLKALRNEDNYMTLMEDIYERENFERMRTGGLAITEVGTDMGAREEQFVSDFFERHHVPVVGGGVHASARAYTGFLSKMRADMFDYMIDQAKLVGRDIDDPEMLRSISTYINSATGRGSLGRLENAAVHLNTIFFSPRLLASRFNFLNPLYYAKLDPLARKEAIRSASQLAGFASAFLTLAAWGGAKVNQDPRNADWAKIRIGNTRIDLLGGFQQPIRLVAQIGSGKVISSTTGDALTLGPGFGKMNRQDILKRFFEGKLAPTPSMVNDWLKGTDFQGQPFGVKRELLQHMIPLMMQDAEDLYREHSGHHIWKGPFDPKAAAEAVGAYAVGGTGIGIQTYGPRQTQQEHFNQHRDDLVKDSQHFGMGEPPKAVIDDLEWKTKWDAAIADHKGETYKEKLPAAAKLWDERFGGTDGAAMLKTIKTERQARYHYEKIRHYMWPEYRQWHHILEHKRDQEIERGG